MLNHIKHADWTLYLMSIVIGLAVGLFLRFAALYPVDQAIPLGVFAFGLCAMAEAKELERGRNR